MTEIKRRYAGNFQASQALQDITFTDLEHPWNFFKLFMSEEAEVNEWCRKKCKKHNGRRSSESEQCDGTMVLKESAARTGREILRSEEPESPEGNGGQFLLRGLYINHPRLHALHKQLSWQADLASVLKICRHSICFKSSKLGLLCQRSF